MCAIKNHVQEKFLTSCRVRKNSSILMVDSLTWLTTCCHQKFWTCKSLWLLAWPTSLFALCIMASSVLWFLTCCKRPKSSKKKFWWLLLPTYLTDLCQFGKLHFFMLCVFLCGMIRLWWKICKTRAYMKFCHYFLSSFKVCPIIVFKFSMINSWEAYWG